MSLGRYLALSLVLSTLTACSGGGTGGPIDGGPQPGDSGVPASSVPVLPSTDLWETTVGASFERVLVASGGTAPLLYSAQGLPTGLALDAQTGTLSGSPTTAGRFDLDVSVRDSAGRSGHERYFLLVLEAPGFLTSALADATVGSPYAARLEASGGKPPLTFSASAGALPSGLVLDSSGSISGTPSAPGTFTFEVSVIDAHGSVKRASFSLEVLVLPELVITTTALPDAYRGSSYPGVLEASGGAPPYAWALVTGALPAGVALGSNGRLSGNPTALGTSSFTARVTDSLGHTSSRALTVTTYLPPSVSPAVLSDAYVAEPYSAAFSATDGKQPHTFSAPTSTLPPGLTLSSSGVLSGTPAASGIFSVEVTVRDANGRAGARAFSVYVYAPLSISPTLPDARTGEFYSQPVSVSGGKPGYSFTLASGSLPAGMTLSFSGVLSGTPPGSFSFTVRATDTNGRFTTRTVSLFVYAPPRITTTSLPDAILNTPYVEVLGYSGGQGTLSWGYSGTLPPGLAFGSDGSVRGTPSATGTWSFTATLSDSAGDMDSRVFPLTVRALPSDGGTLPDGGTQPDGGTSPDGGTQPDAGVPFTVAHWNIEWFGSDSFGPPRSTSPGGPLDDIQFANARDIVLNAGVNLWGLIEITDGADFQALKAQLPGYDGFLSDDPRVNLGSTYYSPTEQKVGVLYDSRLTFQSATLILTSFANDFAGRPPLRVDFLTPIHGVESPLTLIVLHMKAFADQSSYERRQRAGLALKNYLDALPSSRVLVVGDWNDDVDQSITFDAGTPLPSPYESFLQDFSDYTFVTRPLSLSGQSSTTDFPDMIDHTLATNEVMTHYLSGSVHVLQPSWIPDYSGTTSDHYPVLSRYDFGALPNP